MRPYACRRIAVALGVTLLLLGTGFGLAFPWMETRVDGFGHFSWETYHLHVVPVWRLQGRPVYTGWAMIYVAFSVLVGAATWFVYPQYRPPPAPPLRRPDS